MDACAASTSAPGCSRAAPPYDFLAERKRCESVAELGAIFRRYSDYMLRWSSTLGQEWGHDQLMCKHAIFLQWYDAELERLCPYKPLWQKILECMGLVAAPTPAAAAGDGSSQPLMGAPAAHSTSSCYRSSTCIEGSHLMHRRLTAQDSKD